MALKHPPTLGFLSFMGIWLFSCHHPAPQPFTDRETIFMHMKPRTEAKVMSSFSSLHLQDVQLSDVSLFPFSHLSSSSSTSPAQWPLHLCCTLSVLFLLPLQPFSQVSVRPVSSDGWLESPGEFPRGGPGTLHFSGKGLAHRPLHLPHLGAGHGSRVVLGWRAERFPVRHAAARLHQRLLRQRLPHRPHPLLGAADCFCLDAVSHLHGSCHAHGAQGGEAAQEGAGGERGSRRRRPGRGEGVPSAEGERKSNHVWWD